MKSIRFILCAATLISLSASAWSTDLKPLSAAGNGKLQVALH